MTKHYNRNFEEVYKLRWYLIIKINKIKAKKLMELYLKAFKEQNKNKVVILLKTDYKINEFLFVLLNNIIFQKSFFFVERLNSFELTKMISNKRDFNLVKLVVCNILFFRPWCLLYDQFCFYCVWRDLLEQ